MIDLTLSVRFRDCDLLGHVNNAVYLTYLEETRAHFWREVIEPTTAFPFILAEVTCRYRSPALYGESLCIQAWVSELGNKSFKMAYSMVETASGRLIAEAVSVQVMFDYATHTTMPIPPDVRQRLADQQAPPPF